MILVKMAARFLSKDTEALFIEVRPQVIRTVKNYKGFVAVAFWRSVADANLLLEDSYWEDEAAATA
jgi:heme-degrading monooxygenase HmoA